MRPEKLGAEFGLSLLRQTIESLGDQWKELSDEDRDVVSAVCMDYAVCLLLVAGGIVGAEQELRVVKASVSKWTFVGRDMVRRTMGEVAQAGLMVAVKAAAALI